MPITRHEAKGILSRVVEANGFVFTAGVTADNSKADAQGQAEQILAEIDRLLGLCGTDKTKVISATIWVSDVSCSPFRVPIARLAAAQAAIKNSK